MGNAPTNELWANVYKLRAKELLEYGEAVTEKARAIDLLAFLTGLTVVLTVCCRVQVQMGELDLQDSKALAKFRDDFRAAIHADREKLVEALWNGYSNKKCAFAFYPVCVLMFCFTHTQPQSDRASAER